MQELACFTFLTSSNHEISASAGKGGTSTNAGCSTIKTPQDPQISPNKNLGVVGCETPHFQSRTICPGWPRGKLWKRTYGRPERPGGERLAGGAKTVGGAITFTMGLTFPLSYARSK